MNEHVQLTTQLRDGRFATICQVLETDAVQILAFLEAVSAESDFLSFGPGEYGIALAQQTDRIRSFSDPPQGVILKAEVAEEIAGMALLDRSRRPRLRHVGELALMVRQDCWGSGLGRALCQTTFAEGKRAGMTRISLRVRADNRRAIRLYESLGFRHEGRLEGSFVVAGVSYDELVMGLRF